MDMLLEKIVHRAMPGLLCLGALSASAYGQNAEIYFIQAGTDPKSAGGGPTYVDIAGRLRENIVVEIFVRHIGPDPLTPLRGFVVEFPCVAEGGLSGSVAYMRGSGFIRIFRPDWLFFQGPHGAADESRCPEGNLRIDTFRYAGVVDISDLGPRYLGEFKLDVSANASGTFLLPLLGDSGLYDLNFQVIPTFFRNLIFTDHPPCAARNTECNDRDPCSFDQCINGVCQRTARDFRGDLAGEGGSCGPDGEVTLFDTFAILDAFQGQFAPGCELINMDIAGGNFIPFCVPDGIIDLYDILAVLDAFQGLDRCCPP